jgi:hypothetical protein
MGRSTALRRGARGAAADFQASRRESVTTTSHHAHAMQECIDNCTRCHAICVETITHCLQKSAKHAQAGHVRLLLDCAQICATSADFMLRGSDLHPRTCGVCAEVCARCAEDCERMADDDMMRRCAEACRRCAESCRSMAGGA